MLVVGVDFFKRKHLSFRSVQFHTFPQKISGVLVVFFFKIASITLYVHMSTCSVCILSLTVNFFLQYG
jgi:hypothetical protein